MRMSNYFMIELLSLNFRVNSLGRVFMFDLNKILFTTTQKTSFKYEKCYLIWWLINSEKIKTV